MWTVSHRRWWNHTCDTGCSHKRFFLCNSKEGKWFLEWELAKWTTEPRQKPLDWEILKVLYLRIEPSAIPKMETQVCWFFKSTGKMNPPFSSGTSVYQPASQQLSFPDCVSGSVGSRRELFHVCSLSQVVLSLCTCTNGNNLSQHLGVLCFLSQLSLTSLPSEVAS